MYGGSNETTDQELTMRAMNRSAASRSFRAGVLCAAMILAGAAADAAQNRWVPLNGPQQGGNVRALLVQSGGSYAGTTLIAGIFRGGVYRSTDGAASWSAINTGLADDRVRSLRTPAGDSSTIFANTMGGGIYRTDDAHAATPTWSRIGENTLPCGFIRSMRLASSTAPFTLYASGCGNIYKSTDSGVNWTLLNGGSSGLAVGGTEANTIRIGGSAGGFGSTTVWIATTGAGIFRSTDDGATWTAANGSPSNELGGSSPPNGLSVFNVVGRTGSSGSLYAFVEGAGVFKSVDGGTNWSDFNTGLPADKKGRALSGLDSIQTDASAGDLFVSIDGDGLYRSADGASWTRMATVDQVPGARNIRPESFTTPLGSTWYVNGFTGIFKSTDNGSNWTQMNTGLPLGNVNNTTSHASTPNTVFAAGAFLYKSTDGGANWNRLTGLPYLTIAGDVTVDPNDANTVYAGTNNSGFWKSEDGGTNWTQMIPTGGGSDVTDGARARILALPSAATPSQTVLYAYFRSFNSKLNRGFYRGTTSDGGTSITWSSINNGGIATLDKRFVRHSPASDATIHASTSAGLYVSFDTGATWNAPPWWAAFPTGRIDIDPADANKLYLGVFATDDMDRPLPFSGVLASADAGASWWQLASNEKMSAIRLAGSGPTANVFGASAGGPGGNLPGAGRCKQWQPSMGSDPLQCQDMLEGVLVNHFETGSSPTEFVVRRASSTNGVYKYIYNGLGQDFDGNGFGDVFWRNTNGQNYVWNMAGLAVDDHGNAPGVSTAFQVAATGDFDGDGHTDILWRHTSDGRNFVWLMNGRSRLSETQLPSVPNTFVVAGAGDFNGDGKADILWRESSGNGRNYIWLMNGNVRLSETQTSTVPLAFSLAGPIDFDGDGKADLLWRNDTDGRNYMWLMDGATRLSETQLPSVATSFAVAGLVDTSGDGKGDIVWRHTTTGATYVWLMNGTVRLSETLIGTVASAWSLTAFADYNGDGMSDFLWRNASTGQDYVWFMNGASSSVFGGIGDANGFIPTVSPASGWGVINK